MPRHECKNTVNSSQSNMSPPESIYSTTASSEYSNRDEGQEKDLKTSSMKMREVLRKEANKSF